jgi:hypothetical protein
MAKPKKKKKISKSIQSNNSAFLDKNSIKPSAPPVINTMFFGYDTRLIYHDILKTMIVSAGLIIGLVVLKFTGWLR